MTDIANSLDDTKDTLKDIATNLFQHTPRSEAMEMQAKAMKAIQKDEGFSITEIKDAAMVMVQWVKKPSRCFDVLERLACRNINKLYNNLKIIYIIEYHLGFRISLSSCDLDQN